MANRKVWNYRSHRLEQLEWGLWKDTCCEDRYFLCFRPSGRNGPVIRRWATLNPDLRLQELQDYVRSVRANLSRRKLGLPEPEVHEPADAVQALSDYKASLQEGERDITYIQIATNSVQRFLDWADVTTLDEIDVRTADAFLQHLASGEKPATARTRNKYRGYLLAWLNWCAARDLIAANPLERLGRATEKRKHIEFPMPDELVDLVKKLQLYDARLITFIVLTGLRRGSILSLNAGSFQEEGILVPHVKGLGQWFLRYDAGCPLWRPDLRDLGLSIWQEEPPTPQQLRKRLEGIRKTAGTTIGFHALRHAFCSWLALMGESMEDIAAWLTHTSPTTTRQHYAHLRPNGHARIKANRRRVFTARSHLLSACQISD